MVEELIFIFNFIAYLSLSRLFLNETREGVQKSFQAKFEKGGEVLNIIPELSKGRSGVKYGANESLR